MSLFFYTRKTEDDKVYKDSFNLNKVVRSVQVDDNKVLVLLDDTHDRSEDVPDVDPKTGKTKGVKRQRNTYSTEISLFDEDVTRFNNLVENNVNYA
jgi:hypothetical protein